MSALDKIRAKQAVQGTFFEYKCSKRKCGKAYWVRAHGPVEGMWRFGSSADFCDLCGKVGPKRTGRIRVDGMIGTNAYEEPLETVETVKVYDVKAHVWCGGINHYLWEVGAKEGCQPDPFEGLNKLRGEGGRLRVTMKVEVLKAGKVTKPFHRDCHICGTRIRKHMHVLRNGKPLCGFSAKAPAEWPKDHWWQAFGTSGRRAATVNCAMCIKEQARLRKKEG